jgi:hypothetical protein
MCRTSISTLNFELHMPSTTDIHGGCAKWAPVQNQQAKLKGKNVYLVPISSNTLKALSMEASMLAMGSTRENAPFSTASRACSCGSAAAPASLLRTGTGRGVGELEGADAAARYAAFRSLVAAPPPVFLAGAGLGPWSQTHRVPPFFKAASSLPYPLLLRGGRRREGPAAAAHRQSAPAPAVAPPPCPAPPCAPIL